ncbi:MAG: type II secretion system F family protein [Clostridiales bacterium]|nr:type II secretion system F family protein [Clostridiales bacterium]
MAKKNPVSRKKSPEELSGFCAEVAMMLHAGLPLHDGMDALARSYAGSPMEADYVHLSDMVIQTGSLREALECCGWPAYMVEMTGIGEQTGHLEEVMNGLSDSYRREGHLRSAISSAVAYPIVLGVMMLLILLAMIIKVLPVFRRVLAGLGVEMTDSGSLMMRLGLNIGVVMLTLVGLLVLAALVCCLLLRTRARAKVQGGLQRLFPPIREINRKMSAARAASVLSMLVSSGYPLDEALEMAGNVLSDQDGRKRLQQVREHMAQGMDLGEAIAASGLFDSLTSCMIRTASVAGCADTALASAARECEQDVENRMDKLVSIIEPTLVGVLSVVIGTVLLSVMLPMAGIISSIL